MTNLQLRSEIAASGLKKLAIAERMGVSDVHFSRMLRRELTSEQTKRVRKAIYDLKEVCK